MRLDRRGFVAGTLTTAMLLGTGGCIPPDQSPAGRLIASLRIIEAAGGGMLGAELFDTASGFSIGLNRAERFGHCSSFKLSLAAMILARDANGIDSADRHIRWSEDDLMFVSPFTTRRLNEGASLRELAEATQKFSDNAAANVLLREVGGPSALTDFWRSIGDEVSRLDRLEPELNIVPPGELRDTTTPLAMSRTVAKLAYGEVLPEAERALLRQWMVDTPTGARRVRAGLPADWRAGDKTGTSLSAGPGGLYVDIGFVEVPQRGRDRPSGPFTFATYYRTRERGNGIDPKAEDALAKTGQVLREFIEQLST